MAKAKANLHKHGIDFADAATGREDESAMTMRDDLSTEEDTIRLISARNATPRERNEYEGQS